ncbi:glycosyltransferase family 1 protein [Fulvivirgaceae bacterium BMA10]|uniref:Glycosyltransferase family 1 protein n=1 Tax=Splendidivirga corallicola TaxID=3051826 RepID=A0ABT8KHK3_9BACT|nr:glycosyltransferase family 1 protein [Fulvivirgaceae bacterium BMA10]
MRIGIEAQRLFRRKKHGMDIVALELIKGLQRIDRENEYIIFTKSGDDHCIDERENFKVVVTKDYPYPLWEQIILPFLVKKHNVDVLHCTSNTAPLFPLVPLVLTLHDIIFFDKNSAIWKGGNSYQRMGNQYRRWIVPRVLKKSRLIITVSDWSKYEIQKYFGKINGKLVRVYNGIDESFSIQTNTSKLNRVKSRYGLPENFLLFLGNTDQRKNLRGVLSAYKLYLQNNPKHYVPLVITSLGEKEVFETLGRIEGEYLKDRIHLIGYVRSEDLNSLYSLATAFLYPSFVEGFGLPILESMTCRTPVITSEITSMPEIAGDAAILVNPYQPEDIADNIQKLLTDKNLYTSLIEKGAARVNHFSFLNMSKEILGLYTEIKDMSSLSKA